MTDTTDDICNSALFRRAIGYEYESTQSVDVGGKIVRVPIVVHVPPDVEACITWLTTRRPDEWKRYPDAEPVTPTTH
jgi:hypothetical protein